MNIEWGRSGEKRGEQASEDFFRVHVKDPRDDWKKESEGILTDFFVCYCSVILTMLPRIFIP